MARIETHDILELWSADTGTVHDTSALVIIWENNKIACESHTWVGFGHQTRLQSEVSAL